MYKIVAICLACTVHGLHVQAHDEISVRSRKALKSLASLLGSANPAAAFKLVGPRALSSLSDRFVGSRAAYLRSSTMSDPASKRRQKLAMKIAQAELIEKALESVSSRRAQQPDPSEGDVELAAGLQANIAEHAAERAQSAALGYGRATKSEPSDSPTKYFSVPREVLGMGDQCPFDRDELIFASPPILSAGECRSLREEAKALMAKGDSQYSMNDTYRVVMTHNRAEVLLHNMPKALEWLNSGTFNRLANFAASCFPEVVGKATDLWIHRGVVVQYQALGPLTHQPIHRDPSTISIVIPLSEQREYTGGGTFIEALNRSIKVEQGCALVHPSAVRHAGHRIDKGERWALVLMLNTARMGYYEHGRRFHARAHQIDARHLDKLPGKDTDKKDTGGGFNLDDFSFNWEEEDENHEEEEEEEDEEAVLQKLRGLLHAFKLTGTNNHEVWFDLGVRAHENGDAEKALWLYKRAEEINPTDAKLLGNMGLACLDLGKPESFEYYQRAYEADHEKSVGFFSGLNFFRPPQDRSKWR